MIDGVPAHVSRPIGVLHPPILFVHGMFAGGWMFERYQKFFVARGHACYAIYLRGHHEQNPVANIGQVRVREYADDARAVARALGRPIVIGHSMGGLIAQMLAESGDALAAVMIASAPPRWISPLGAALLYRMLFHLPALFLSRPIRATRADADMLMWNHTPVADRNEQFGKLVPESGRAGRELAFGAVAVNADKVDVPMLSIGASDDRFVVPRVARSLAKKYGAEHLEFANHGHQIITEPGWEMPARAIGTWLDRVLGSEDAA